MARLTRLILALSLVVQSLPGIGFARCAQMAIGADQVVRVGMISACGPASEIDQSSCPCCDESSTGSPAGLEGGAADSCRCDVGRPEQPITPPAEPTLERTQLVAVVLPSLLSLARPAHVGAHSGLGRPDGSPKRAANSIQSVLCVWLM
ncbi:MAG: hypothetical protein IT434_10400 [Phycisphaerales bacterium]|jgi:hypothetical protein|nr:hypothetical protein [Phycisphaerales bacterium]